MEPKNDKQLWLAEVSSGEVIITGPDEKNNEEGVALTAGEGVILKVNGQEVRGSKRVYIQDRVEIIPLHLQEPARAEVKISDDKMIAEAIYFPAREIHYTIPDYPPLPELVITAVREEKYAGPGADLSLEEIKEVLRANGVVYGFDGAVLSGLISRPGSWQVVALGRPPVQGRDGFVEPLFREGLQRVSFDQAKARIDYRRRFEIPQVEKGQVIARVHPPFSGEPGMTVTGETVSPQPVYPAELRCEAGVDFKDAQTEVIALTSGVPVYREWGKLVSVLRVDNIYYHRGNVDIKSGHIDFEGHLKIGGEIEEGLRVKAEGDIEIAKNGSGAEIIAGGNIIFKKNCIKCRVRAGWQTLQLKEFRQLFNDLTEEVRQALNMGRDLVEGLQRRSFYTEAQLNIILRSLLQKKLPALPELSRKVFALSGEVSPALPESLKRSLQSCDLCLRGGGLLTLAYLERLHEVLYRSQEEKFMADSEDKATISAYYVQNSSLTCPGDILVNGPGAYNSHLVCSGEVHVDRIFRGGSIKAGGNIYIGEAGVPRLTRMQGLIETDSRHQIYLGRVYENTRVKIGKPEFCLEQDLNNIKICLNREGDIEIGCWGK